MTISRSLTILPIVFCILFSQTIGAKCCRADYVIVGVGTAGAVVGKKLSDDKKTSVIALHIGENLTQDPFIKFSENAIITVADAVVGPPFYQNGETVPQTAADNQEITWAMALPEGGASSINAGAYARGTNQVYAHFKRG